MLYYANGGPGPATKLLRVDAPEGGDWWAWMCAPAERWTVRAGWSSDDDAQAMIKMSGEFGLIDESEVLDVQAQLLENHMRCRA
jgi:hypothetical protein